MGSARPRERDIGLIAAAALVAWGAQASRSHYLVAHTSGALGRSLQAEPEAGSGNQGADAATWVLAVVAATVTKLTSSIDDICWLLPFVAGADRTTNLSRAGQYILTMVAVAGEAHVDESLVRLLVRRMLLHATTAAAFHLMPPLFRRLLPMLGRRRIWRCRCWRSSHCLTG